MDNLNSFQPNWTSKPGDTITDVLQERNISIENFAREMNLTPEYIFKIIDGYVAITEDIANKLNKILGASIEFWMRRESQYKEDLYRIEKAEESEWLKELPLREMIKLGWINETKNKLATCLKYFGVPDIKSWRNKYNEEIKLAAFRTSPSFKSDIASVAAWFRQGEIQSASIKCDDWNEELFEKTLVEIRSLTRKKNPKEFIPELIKLCAKCGVAIAIVKTPQGCPSSGATKFVSPTQALLLLSFRYLSDDQFWFTFFHEAGHLLLHNKKKLFIEEVEGTRFDNEDEKDANLFAGEMLIPSNFQYQLKTLRGKRGIINFAMQVGVSPGIVVGQMQHYGYVDRKYLNGFKRRYTWEDIYPNNNDVTIPF